MKATFTNHNKIYPIRVYDGYGNFVNDLNIRGAEQLIKELTIAIEKAKLWLK